MKIELRRVYLGMCSNGVGPSWERRKDRVTVLISPRMTYVFLLSAAPGAYPQSTLLVISGSYNSSHYILSSRRILMRSGGSSLR
jgi:hypothetical protein